MRTTPISPSPPGSPPQRPRAVRASTTATRRGAPAIAGPDLAGRHANTVGDGFGRLVLFTILGAVIPGAGLVAAGRRKLGWTIIGLLAFVVGAVVTLVVSGRALPLAARLGTDPAVLLAAAVAIIVVAVAWCLIIVGSHLALRRNGLTGTQRVLSVVLVASLMGIVALPSATAARYAVTGRSALSTVFDDDGGDRSHLANPDVHMADPWTGTPRIEVLVLGSDAGPDRKGIRPDTIFVASIDTRTGDTVLMNLPRNLRFAPFAPGSVGARQYPKGFTCGSTDKSDACILNAVWQWGEQHPEAYPSSAEPGLAATREVVGQVLGLVVDYDVVVNLAGFEEVVDAMGGLRLNVERDIPIGGGKNLQTGRKYPITGYIQQGPNQLLNGYDALWYARSREGSTDYDRMRRQQCTVGAAVSQFDAATLAQAFPAIAASAERNVETDISYKQLPAFVELGQRIQAGPGTRSLAFTDEVIDSSTPDYPQIRALVQQALVAPPPTPTATAPTPSATAAPSGAGPTTASATSSPAASATPSSGATSSGATPSGSASPTTPVGVAVDTAQACG